MDKRYFLSSAPGGLASRVAHPVHLHLRAQEGLFALYVTPLCLELCAELLSEYLHERFLLVLTFDSSARIGRNDLTLAQWLRQEGVQAHSISSYALVPAKHLSDLARLSPSRVVFAETALLPDELAGLDITPMELDTFAASSWGAAFHKEVGNRLYCESRNNRFTHLLSSERRLVMDGLSKFLRAYLLAQQQQVSSLEDFPPLIHEQLWQYAAQGLAPRRVHVTNEGLELLVALGTPERSACLMAQACAHMTQIQRGFVLRWDGGTWEICSTEDSAEDSSEH